MLVKFAIHFKAIINSRYTVIKAILGQNNIKTNEVSKMRKIALSVVLSILIICITACNSKVTGHQIVGKWEHDGHVFEFCSDGFVKTDNDRYPFSVTNEKITIDRNGEAFVLDYSINHNGTLTMNGLIYYPITR